MDNRKDREHAAKLRILDAVLQNYDFPDDFDIPSFQKSWTISKLTSWGTCIPVYPV